MDCSLDRLAAAVRNGDTGTVRQLIQQGDCLKDPEFASRPFFYDWTDLDMIRLLAEAGADINAINEVGEWALRNAAWRGDTKSVAYLLSVGAKSNLTDTGQTAIHMAVCSDNLAVVRLLLESGADLNTTDVDGWTCLWWLKSAAMATFLLNHGANPSIPGWGMIDEPDDLPEDHEEIPVAARVLLRVHRLKAQ